MSDLLNDLNEKQRDVVLYNDGPSLVVAGAGSGKTRVLTYKIAYLLQQGMLPQHILALTFTNKAAREMKARIATRVGEELASRLWMGTFHSIFARILRIESERIGFTSGFTIYDASDSKSLMGAIAKEMELNKDVYKPDAISRCISGAKNRLVLPEMYDKSLGMSRSEGMEQSVMAEVYRRYQSRCKAADAMDFDDLLLYTYVLFDTFPEVAKKYEDRFQFVLVDEYQDTNFAQHEIIKKLTMNRQRLCVVGDDAQSIYGFRGAEIDNILRFTECYPTARTFKLECNYRSTKKIVQAANSLIAHNQRRIPKEVYTQNDEGSPVKIYAAYNDIDEGYFVAKQVARLHARQGIPYKDIAVLYRANAQSRSFEECFRKQDIPYRIYGGLSFYQRKEIKDVIAYFRLAVNPHDEEAFKRVVNVPGRGIGATSVGRIVEAANANGCSLWQVLLNAQDPVFGLKPALITKFMPFRSMIETFVTDAREKSALDMAEEILRASGLWDELSKGDLPEDVARRENVRELLNAVGAFVNRKVETDDREGVSLSDYLQEVSLLTDVEESGDNEDKVTMMTVHSAKGLEFGYVFVVGMEEDLFPSSRSTQTNRAIEEERRLFYVAVTRAEKECYLSHAKQRYQYGSTRECRMSRFLRELDPACVAPFGGFEGGFEKNSSRGSFGESSFGKSSFAYGRGDERPPISSLDRDEYRDSGRFGNSGGGSYSGGSAGRGSYRGDSGYSGGFSRPASVRPNIPAEMKRVRTSVSSSDSASSINVQSATVNSTIGVVRVHQKIMHERFGLGVIEQLINEGGSIKAVVNFQKSGTKNLLLKFAKFSIVE